MPAKSKTPIMWPEGHFTIDEALANVRKMCPDFVEITLRFRVKKATESKEIAVIGRLKPSIGRPKLVFAKAPVTEEVIKSAYAAGVLPPADETVKVQIASVKPPEKVVVPTVPVSTDVKSSTPTVTA
jgi:hypothetical protein